MAYLTADEYQELIGQPAPDNFDTLAQEAGTELDRRTLCRLWGRDLTAFPDQIRMLVKLAAAHQVQYLDQCGGVSALNDLNVPGMSLGKYSYTGGAAETSASPASPLLDGDLAIVNAYLRGQME